MIKSSLNDPEAVALTIYGESRGEKVEGQIAVGCVIRNRLDKSSGKTWKDICFEPRQFSCWNEDDPNYLILIKLAHELIEEASIITNPTLNQCLWIAEGIINRTIIDNTGGARNYLTTALYNQHSVQWAEGMKVSEVIDHHTFLV